MKKTPKRALAGLGAVASEDEAALIFALRQQPAVVNAVPVSDIK
jgi:hypothetical protein